MGVASPCESHVVPKTITLPQPLILNFNAQDEEDPHIKRVRRTAYIITNLCIQ